VGMPVHNEEVKV